MYCTPLEDAVEKDGWHWVRWNNNPPRLEFWHAGAGGWDYDDGYFAPEYLPDWIYDRPATEEDIALAFPTPVKNKHWLY